MIVKNFRISTCLIAVSSLGAALSSMAAQTIVLDANIPIPATFGGVYLDLTNNATNSSTQTGASNGEVDSYTLSFSEPASGDWDFNFFFGGIGIAHNSTANPYRDDPSNNLSAIHALGVGDMIDGATATPSGALPLTTISFGGSGSGLGGGSGVSASEGHMGAGGDQFQAGESEYLGFILDSGTPEQTYGWMRVTFQDDGSAGTIHDFALSDSPFKVAAVPEPAAAILLLLGVFPVVRRRRA